MMSFGAKVIGNRIKGREKALHLSWEFEPPHGSLSLPCRLVRVFGAIIQAFVLAMFDAGYAFFLGGRIAGQFVRDDHTWYVPQPFEQLAEKLLGCILVASTLHQNSKQVAIVIASTPEIVLLSIHFEKYLIQMPCIANLATTMFQFIGRRLPTFQTPLPDGFISQHSLSLGHQLFNVAKTEREAENTTRRSG
jgi:hypothetical protein